MTWSWVYVVDGRIFDRSETRDEPMTLAQIRNYIDLLDDPVRYDFCDPTTRTDYILVLLEGGGATVFHRPFSPF